MSGTDLAAEALADQRAISTKRHFEVMDGLRGIAALAVVLFHSYQTGGYVPNGQLAVDLFFLLSGFVIAYSYDDRLRAGMSRGDFLLRRFIRLYPMLLIGALGGIALALIHNKTNHADAYPLRSLLSSGLLSLAVLPYLAQGALGSKTFTFNPPMWSLFFELVANIVYALFHRLLSNAVLVAIVVLGLAGVVWGGGLAGGGARTFVFGFPRVACGFFGGMLLFRLWQAGRLPRVNGRLLPLAVLFLALLAVPYPIGGWSFLPAFALMAALIVGAAGAKSGPMDKYCALLGEISYPVYLIHWLTLYVFTFIGTKAGLVAHHYNVVVAAHLLCVPVIAWAVARWYELPARKWLTARLVRRRAPRSV